MNLLFYLNSSERTAIVLLLLATYILIRLSWTAIRWWRTRRQSSNTLISTSWPGRNFREYMFGNWNDPLSTWEWVEKNPWPSEPTVNHLNLPQCNDLLCPVCHGTSYVDGEQPEESKRG